MEVIRKEKQLSKEGKKPEETFKKIGKALVYFLVFLLPLFFLPWTSNVLDFNKQALLSVFGFLALICWLIKTLTSNQLEINLSFLYFGVIIFLLVSGLSVAFSLWPYGSFWGWPLSISSCLLSLIGFFILYFLVVNLFKKEELPLLFFVLFLSGFLVALFSLFQLFGRFLLPFDFSQVLSFNPIGTVNSLAIYLSILLVLALPFFFFVGRIFRIILGIFGLTFLFSLVLINFKTAWLVLLIGVSVLFALGIVNLRRFRPLSFITLMLLFLVISLFFSFFHSPLFRGPTIPLEISPNQRTEIGILRELPAKSLVLGSGPGTFVYNWSKYKSPDLNQTIFWAVRFGSGASEILDRIITNGILGILALFFLIGSFLKIIFSFLLKKRGVIAQELEKRSDDNLDWFLAMGILGGFIGLLAAFFLYPANFSFWLIFWLLLGASSLLEEKEKKTWLLTASPVKNLAFSFTAVLILVLGFGFLILFSQKYLAEVKYLQALRAWQEGNTLLARDYFLRATNFNPKIDFYWRDLSQIYLIQLNEVLLKQDLSQEERTSQAQVLIANSINSANQATNLNPQNVANWAVRGFGYRNLTGILRGTEDWAIRSYQSALELEPTNPYLFTEIGQVYLAKTDLAGQSNQPAEREENLKLALENFERAISLKSDYAPAHFQIAMIYVREGKTREAISKLEETKLVAPLDTGLAFQLGIIYYNDKQFDKAKGELERAVALDSNYSNARYFLGLIYDQEGKKDKAIEQFVRIEDLNPENQEVKKILANLRADKSALEGVVPGEPPVEEKPPERLEK